MRVVIDRYVPYVAQMLAPYMDVVALEPEAITAETVREADALVIRTRTRVDASLLASSRVRLVATATIGYDHIDTRYCEEHGIRWMACPGCNAQAVCDYVEEVLDEVKDTLPIHRIGVVGVGHVGSLVAEMARRKGYEVCLNDPPKGIGVSLDEIAQTCDVITFHTPLTKTGDWATYHLCDAALLNRCHPKTLIINAARGGVVDETALLASGNPCVIDCWENEPHINRELLSSTNTLLASFHIAGYSMEGKRNASQMCLTALREFFQIPHLPEIATDQEEHGDNAAGWLQRVTEQLRANPDGFEQIRKQYKLR